MKLVITGQIAKDAICKHIQEAPIGFQVTIKEPTRSLEQNDLLHAELQEIADKVKWAGENLDVEAWKRLMTAGWCRATGKSASIYPAVEGQGFDVLYQRTSTLSKGEMIELIEYIRAWKADRSEFQ